MRRMIRWAALAAVVAGSWISHAARAADPAPAAQAGPKTAEFNRVFADWKTLLGEMRQLRTEYRQAQPPRKTEIEKRFNELVAQGDKILPKLTQAAEEAYLEAPAAGQAQAEFLAGILADKCISDDYEPAVRIAKMLVDNGYGEKDKKIYGWGGFAAFASGDFDLASTYLEKAKEANVLATLPPQIGRLAEQWLTELPYYKQAWKKEQEIRAAEAKADDLPRVLLKTSKGEIEIEMFENEAPIATANFVSLVDKGFYNGLIFHRVLPQFMAQGGDPTGTGAGGPGYSIPCECYQPNHRVHFRGTLSMAHAGRDTGGSQFFLTFVPTHHLDGKHTAFGRVIKGMDVLAKIQRRDPENPDAAEADKIVEAKVLRKRSHAYEPKKLPDPRQRER